jgi:hypothetical protein
MGEKRVNHRKHGIHRRLNAEGAEIAKKLGIQGLRVLCELRV